jgi:2-oxoglutarate dehydrogenase E2 component (dihydrolipoamide succinyltransferase)
VVAAPVVAAPVVAAPVVAAPVVAAPVVAAPVVAAPVVAAPVVAPPAPISGLLAQRVAVVAGPDGAARLTLLEEGMPVPAGAIVAVMVPLVAAEGEPLARLLAGRR